MGPPPLGPLMEELVEEVLLRVPPDDPASLVRAALVCKRWCRLISGASFRRRFRELHPAAPILGYIYERYGYGAKFVPASSFRPPHAFRENWRALDAHHGRVLAFAVESFSMGMGFIVWDPVTDGVQILPILKFRPITWSAAVVCATAGCDHLDCRGGPFIVVVVVTTVTDERRMSAYKYSSEQGAWSEPITVQHHNDCIMRLHRAHVGNAVYFNYEMNKRILKYDLRTRELSLIDLPSEFHPWHIVLMEASDGGLGFATIQESKLALWSREAGPERNAGWTQQRTFELDKLLPVSDCNISVTHCGHAIAHAPYVVAVADTVGVIFMWTGDGLFSIHLNSSRVKRIGDCNSEVVPYTTFLTPALDMSSTSDEGPEVDA